MPRPPDPPVVPSLFPRQGRARSDQRHVADQNVVKLRQFVERKLSQPLAAARDPWVVYYLKSDSFRVAVLVEQFGETLFGVETHGTDFEHLEFPPILSDSGLREEHRTAILQSDKHRNKREQRQRQQQQESRAYNVKGAFGECCPGRKTTRAPALPLDVQIQEATHEWISGRGATPQQEEGQVIMFHGIFGFRIWF